MAQRSVVHKLELKVADVDRAHYADYALTVARHPSETEERMMMRVLAFALNAEARLEFGRGLSTDDEADLWSRDLTGALDAWIDVGLPDARAIRKACGRAVSVTVIAYGGNRAELWWNANRDALGALANLRVESVDPEASAALAAMARRSMRLSATIGDGQAWIASDEASVCVEPQVLKRASGADARRR